MFVEVLMQVAILFILILIGFVLTKFNMLTQSGVESMTDIVLTLVTPCVIIKSFIREFKAELLKGLLISLAASVVLHIVFIVIASVFLHSKEKESERVLRFAAVFSNCGFMSIPLQQALLGDMGVFYGASFLAVFNIFIWSYGVISMSGDKKYLTAKKLIINPGIIGIILGFLIFFFSVPIPEIFKDAIDYMASLNTPLPMLIIGYHLAKSNLVRGFKYPKCYFAAFIKLILFPLISLGLCYICGIRGTMLTSIIISVAAPTAAITTMFSSKFSQNTALSVNIISVSTLLSIITMPAVITLAQYLA